MSEAIENDPFVGVWELDPSTLEYQHGRPGRRAIYTVESIPDGLQFTLEGEDADGKPLRYVYGGRLDGSEVPLPGLPFTLALNRPENGTIESIARKDGRVVDRWTRTLSEDGQAMVVTQHGVTPDGKPFTNSSVYRRRGECGTSR